MLEDELAGTAAQTRHYTEACRASALLMVGEDTSVRVMVATPLVAAGECTVEELECLLREGRSRVRAACVLQAAAREKQRRNLTPEGPHAGLRGVVRTGFAEITWRTASCERAHQRMRHGVDGSRAVLSALEAMHGEFVVQKLGADAWSFVRSGARAASPSRRRAVLEGARVGADRAYGVSIGMARGHAARRIQWAFRIGLLCRSLRRQLSLISQLRAGGEARREEQEAARSHARSAVTGRGRGAGGLGGGSDEGGHLQLAGAYGLGGLVVWPWQLWAHAQHDEAGGAWFGVWRDRATHRFRLRGGGGWADSAPVSQFPLTQPMALRDVARLSSGAWALPRPPEHHLRRSLGATRPRQRGAVARSGAVLLYERRDLGRRRVAPRTGPRSHSRRHRMKVVLAMTT